MVSHSPCFFLTSAEAIDRSFASRVAWCSVVGGYGGTISAWKQTEGPQEPQDLANNRFALPLLCRWEILTGRKWGWQVAGGHLTPVGYLLTYLHLGTSKVDCALSDLSNATVGVVLPRGLSNAYTNGDRFLWPNTWIVFNP